MGSGDGRQVGPSLGLVKVRGGGEGPGKVRGGREGGVPLEAFRTLSSGSWEKLCPWDEALCFCPGQRKWRTLQQNSGKPGRTGRKGEGPGGPAWMGTRDEQIRLWVALGHDVWTLPCQCLVFVAYGYFRTK